MKPVLHARHRAILARFLRRGALLAFDFDGTLAPIVADPAMAWLGDSTHARLQRLAALTPVAVITGRARDEASRLLSDVPLAGLIGNHGMEGFDGVPASFAVRVAGWHATLRSRLAGETGIVLEDKRFSLAVHYRHCPDPRSAGDRVRAAGADLPGARLIGGKFVLNIVPAESTDKGEALQRLCRALGHNCAIYAGDDDTDEDVFCRRRTLPVLGIRVGDCEDSAADFMIAAQAEIDELLDELLRAVIALGPGAAVDQPA